MCEARGRRVAIAGLAFLEAAKCCRTPDAACDFTDEGFPRFPPPARSIDRANLRQYAATSASAEGNILILLRPRSPLIV